MQAKSFCISTAVNDGRLVAINNVQGTAGALAVPLAYPAVPAPNRSATQQLGTQENEKHIAAQ